MSVSWLFDQRNGVDINNSGETSADLVLNKQIFGVLLALAGQYNFRCYSPECLPQWFVYFFFRPAVVQ